MNITQLVKTFFFSFLNHKLLLSPKVILGLIILHVFLLEVVQISVIAAVFIL